MRSRLSFRLPVTVRKAFALLLLFVMAFGGAGTAQGAATEGYDPLRQITAQVLRANLLILQDLSGSMKWDVYGNQLYEEEDSVGRLVWFTTCINAAPVATPTPTMTPTASSTASIIRADE